jgi:2-polyprenyl-3-methyl-5-hydroxy-6-metoxy-1,4-benzoquinol methylase
MSSAEHGYDPLGQAQLLLWRAARLLRRNPGKSQETTPLDRFDDEGRERFYARGAEQIATLTERIEAQTGFELDGRRALDFGCGVGRNALALAERCEHVYGLDVSPKALREADRNAKRLNLDNVEWMEPGGLADLGGRYDLVISFFVFQHIPSREGERIFDTLVRGLRPGGAGALQVTLRPLVRGPARQLLYMNTNAYSLNRLGRLLADASVTEWHVMLHARPGDPDSRRRSYDDATIIFRKD